MSIQEYRGTIKIGESVFTAVDSTHNGAVKVSTTGGDIWVIPHKAKRLK